MVFKWKSAVRLHCQWKPLFAVQVAVFCMWISAITSYKKKRPKKKMRGVPLYLSVFGKAKCSAGFSVILYYYTTRLLYVLLLLLMMMMMVITLLLLLLLLKMPIFKIF